MRYWARGSGEKSKLQDTQDEADARAFGLEIPAENEPDDFGLWRDNLATFQLFMALQTQWNWLTTMESAQRIGLNYAGVESVMRFHGIKNRSEVFVEIQVMELAALEVFSERD